MSENSFSDEQLREFVLASHHNLLKVQELLAEFPEILNFSYHWGVNDWETGIQAAAHVGNVHIADFLLASGAPLEICTAAMLGRQADVERLLLEDSTRINAVGGHGIPLMPHVALSGNVALAQMLFEQGAHQEMSFALGNAVNKGHLDMARWILENGSPDLTWENFEGQTALKVARDAGNDAMLALLRRFGAD